jgi:hypothetical protein
MNSDWICSLYRQAAMRLEYIVQKICGEDAY